MLTQGVSSIFSMLLRMIDHPSITFFSADRPLYVSKPLHPNCIQPMSAQMLLIPPTLTHHPLLVPLSLASSTNLQVHSAPCAACTDTGSWPTYTPLSTASMHHSSPKDLYDLPPASASLGYMPSMQTFRNNSKPSVFTGSGLVISSPTEDGC